MTYAKTFYLLIRIAAGPIDEVGPMEQAECTAIKLAIEAAAVPSVAAVECREARVLTVCPLPGYPPGFPGGGRACPVWEDRPLVGSWQDQK